MRFLIAVIDVATDTGTSDEMVAIDEFNEMLQSNNHWVFACGIGAPSTATVIDNRADAGVSTDGPLITSEEFMSGFWIVEAEDLDAVKILAAGGSKACNRKVEVRPLLG
jgi:hypothetical protein